MKYLTGFFLIYIVLFTNALAQREWAPIGAYWYYTWGDVWGPPVEYLRMESIKDTIVAEKNCRLLRSIITHDNGIDDKVRQTHFEDIIIYQEEYKVFRWVEDQFRILYDFSLEQGDTLQVYIPVNERWLYNSRQDSIAYFVIDSVTTLVLGGETFTAQLLNAIETGAAAYAVGFADWVYESIGSRTYFRPYHALLCDAKCPWPLRCYTYEDFTHKWFDIPCDTIVPFIDVGVKKPIWNDEVKIYPNPGQIGGYISLEVEESIRLTDYYLYLVDVMGKMYPIVPSQDRLYLDPKTFVPGSYHLIIKDHNRIMAAKTLMLLH